MFTCLYFNEIFVNNIDSHNSDDHACAFSAQNSLKIQIHIFHENIVSAQCAVIHILFKLEA